MAKHALYKKLLTQIKSNSRTLPMPFKLLDRIKAYQDNTHRYPLRSGTMPTSVKLYGPILTAAALMENKENPYFRHPFRMIEKRGIGGSCQIVLEAGMPDGTSLIINATKDRLRASIYEEDGTTTPTVAFKDMTDTAIAFFVLALLPEVLQIDSSNANSAIAAMMDNMGTYIQDSVASPWVDKNDIPEIASDAFYFLDAVMCVLTDHMDVNCGDTTSDTPAELDAAFFQNKSNYTGKLIAEDLADGTWNPLLVNYSGKAPKHRYATITISEARDEYSVYTAHRNWNAEELAMIPVFPDNMPVMPEVIRMANRIVKTRNDKNPVVTGMWRGETGFGKSTGMRQLACILNIPFYTQTCHPAMEASEFLSSWVPAEEEDADEFPDASSWDSVSIPLPSNPEPTLEWAYHHILEMDKQSRKEFLANRDDFFFQAVMDQDQAEQALFGQVFEIDLAALCSIYSSILMEFQKSSYETKLKMVGNQDEKSKDEKNPGPQFKMIIAPYMKAMTRGYMVEIQEASRIRDSGVLVSLNEFDRPGAIMHLANGKPVVRHKDAIQVTTDNVGFSSCRPLDPSFIRRNGFIIDSYDMAEDVIKYRVKANTGVTDDALVNLAYKLWLSVRETCAQNSITDGSTSPVELERFVQAVKYDGEESLAANLDDCIISKATSSIEDQKIIRSNCQAIVLAA